MKGLSTQLEKARDRLANVETHLLEEFIREFDSSFDQWQRCVKCLAHVDCLLSLASFSSSSTVGTLTRPKFVETDSPFLDIRDAFHPALVTKYYLSHIPEDTLLTLFISNLICVFSLRLI